MLNPLNFLINLLYPRHCLSCKKLGKYFCEKCSTTIRKTLVIEKNICPICEKPAVGGFTHPSCQTKYTIDGIASIFLYKGAIRDAIRFLKYKKVRDLLPELTNLTTTSIKQDPNRLFLSINRLIKKEKPIFLPMPLHWWRRRTRWFNQTELLGRPLADFWNLKMKTNILKRTKLKQPQIKLKGKQRQENVKSVFQTTPNIAISQYRNILLFDDVWTTGSTLKEAAHILKKAGVKKVWGLTLAR